MEKSPIIKCDFVGNGFKQILIDVRDITSIDLKQNYDFTINLKNGISYATDFGKPDSKTIEDLYSQNADIIKIE